MSKTKRAGGLHYAWWVMVSCCAMMVTGLGINGSAQSIFLTPVAQSLGCGIGSLSLHSTIRMLSATAFMPLAGRMLRKHDVRIVLSAAFLVQGLSQVVLGSLTTLPQFYVIGAVSGIANAFIFYIPVPMLINNWFYAKAGTVLGVAAAFSGVGGAIFTPVGSYLIQNVGWQTAYRVLGVAGLIIVLPFTLFVIRGTPAEKGLLPYGMHPKAAGTAKAEGSGDQKGIMAKQALKMPAFYLIALFGMSLNMAAALVMHIPGLTEHRGFTSAHGAMAVSLFTLGIIAGKLAVGALSDRLGAKRAIYIIAGLGTAGLIVMLVNQSVLFLHYLGAFSVGMCTALATLGPPLVLQARFGRRDYATIFSYVSTACALAGALGTSVYGFVYDVTGSYDSDLIFLAVMLAVGLAALSLALRKSKDLTKEGE